MKTADAIKELMTAWNRVQKIVEELNPTFTPEQIYQSVKKVIETQLGIVQ